MASANAVTPVGDAAPFCECHTEPMTKKGFTPGGKQQWRCTHVVRREGVVRYWADPEKGRQDALRRAQEQFAKDPDFHRRKNLKRLYDLTLEQYGEMLEAQDGGCAICGAGPGKRRLAVDHDHVTGEVRGLLCPACNLGIGYFEDNPDLMEASLLYLRGGE